MDGPTEVCVDDLDRLTASEQQAVADRIRLWPDWIGVRIASRTPLPPSVRTRLGGLLFERGPADLALTSHQIGQVLADEYAVTDPEAPSTLYELTRGWPALVHFAGDQRTRGAGADLERDLRRPESPVMSWIASDVLTGMPTGVADVLHLLAGLDPITPELVRHVCAGRAAGCADAADAAFEHLRAVGLLVPHRRLHLLGREGWSLVPLVAHAVDRTGAGEDPRVTAEAAGQWYEQFGHPFAAARAYALAGASDQAERLVATSGPEMLAHGDATGILALVDIDLAGTRTARVGHTVAEAALLSGDTARARQCYAPLVQDADASGWTTALAHRVAALQYTSGDLHDALATLDRVADGSAHEPVDERVLWLACRANVRSMLGQESDAQHDAQAAHVLAEASDSPRAQCASHQALAKCTSGSRKQAHQSMAGDAARRAGDVVALARVLGNQSYALLAAARYREAIPVCRAALSACEMARPMGALPVALHNLAEALTRVGEYDEARWHLERAIVICRRLAPTRASSGLLGLGDVHRTLGNHY